MSWSFGCARKAGMPSFRMAAVEKTNASARFLVRKSAEVYPFQECSDCVTNCRYAEPRSCKSLYGKQSASLERGCLEHRFDRAEISHARCYRSPPLNRMICLFLILCFHGSSLSSTVASARRKRAERILLLSQTPTNGF